MAVAERERRAKGPSEPIRTPCEGCGALVLVVFLAAVKRHEQPPRMVVAEPFEWEPRARCYVCATIEARTKACPACGGANRACKRCGGRGHVKGRRANCDRCGGEGFVGRDRPPGPMLAIDLAWSDEGHARLIAPGTSRTTGEALYELHLCPLASLAAIVDL